PFPGDFLYPLGRGLAEQRAAQHELEVVPADVRENAPAPSHAHHRARTGRGAQGLADLLDELVQRRDPGPEHIDDMDGRVPIDEKAVAPRQRPTGLLRESCRLFTQCAQLRERLLIAQASLLLERPGAVPQRHEASSAANPAPCAAKRSSRVASRTTESPRGDARFSTLPGAGEQSSEGPVSGPIQFYSIQGLSA